MTDDHATCRDCGGDLKKLTIWVHDRPAGEGWAGTPHEPIPGLSLVSHMFEKPAPDPRLFVDGSGSGGTY